MNKHIILNFFFINLSLIAMEQNVPRPLKRSIESVWRLDQKPKKPALDEHDLLYEGIEENNVAKVQKALEKGANANIRGYQKLPLARAIDTALASTSEQEANKAKEIITLLLKNGASPDRISIMPSSQSGIQLPLLCHLAQNHRAYCIVEILLAHQASVNIKDKTDKTPLLHCILAHTDENPCTPMAQLLIEHGAALHEADCNGRTPLSEAVNRNIFDLAALLLRYGATPTQTMLTAAQTNGNYKLQKLLVEQGCPVTFYPSTLKKRTENYLQEIKLLLKHGAIVNREYSDYFHNDPNKIFLCDIIGKDKEIKDFGVVELLLSHGLFLRPGTHEEIVTMAQEHLHPLCFAAGFCDISEVKKQLQLLIKKEASNAQEILDHALMWAASRNQLTSANELLSCNAQPKKALKVMVPILMQKKKLNTAITETELFGILEEKHRDSPCFDPTKKPLLSKLMVRTLRCNNIELAKLFIPYFPLIKPSLEYLDTILCRPLDPATRITLLSMRDFLIPRASLKEQIMRRGNFSAHMHITVSAQPAIMPQKLLDEIAHRMWCDQVIAKAVHTQ